MKRRRRKRLGMTAPGPPADPLAPRTDITNQSCTFQDEPAFTLTHYNQNCWPVSQNQCAEGNLHATPAWTALLVLGF